jgi:transposase-like protein
LGAILPKPSTVALEADFTVEVGRDGREEGEVLDMLALKRRKKQAGARLLWKVLTRQGVRPQAIATDELASYSAAAKELGLSDRHQPDRETRQ